MSAYIVDHDHIDALLSYAIEHGVRYVANDTCIGITDQNATEVGAILLTENERSVRSRYSDCPVDELPGTIGEDAANYKFKRWPFNQPLTALTILKACDGFDYQACETDDYSKSLANTIVTAIRKWAITRLPDYSDADGWELRRKAVRA